MALAATRVAPASIVSVDGYDVAQICREGHIVTTMAARYPQFRQDFCGKCGAPTTMTCENCGSAIRGYYHVSGVIGGSVDIDRPSFCHKCGRPYPWTEAALDAARAMADELDGLKPDEREALKSSLDDLVQDTVRTPVAVLRFKKLALKAGSEGAAALRDVLVGVVTEGVRRGIWGA